MKNFDILVDEGLLWSKEDIRKIIQEELADYEALKHYENQINNNENKKIIENIENPLEKIQITLLDCLES